MVLQFLDYIGTSALRMLRFTFISYFAISFPVTFPEVSLCSSRIEACSILQGRHGDAPKQCFPGGFDPSEKLMLRLMLNLTCVNAD